jgi:hypothetical protein
VTYRDTFTPRPFQRDVISSVLDGMASGRRSTTVLASPGSGKTLTYQAVATYLHRQGLIDFVAAFVPRLTLAKQCETDWLHRDVATGELHGDHRLFDPRERLGAIRHIPTRLPLTPPGQTGIGIVTTYSALVSQPEAFIEGWAATNKGRFLLVADEAQFCGAANDERSGGTKAGMWMEVAPLPRTYATSDRNAVPVGWSTASLADYDEPDEQGKRRLLSHAEASYASIAEVTYVALSSCEAHRAAAPR